ncbi:hypothetical protein CLU79DRAFT_770621 [Phycomyces nitens]|nr:hypothetical protein CLU79DRAFT_770621 [Phycomyces nitens]
MPSMADSTSSPSYGCPSQPLSPEMQTSRKRKQLQYPTSVDNSPYMLSYAPTQWSSDPYATHSSLGYTTEKPDTMSWSSQFDSRSTTVPSRVRQPSSTSSGTVDIDNLFDQIDPTLIPGTSSNHVRSFYAYEQDHTDQPASIITSQSQACQSFDFITPSYAYSGQPVQDVPLDLHSFPLRESPQVPSQLGSEPHHARHRQADLQLHDLHSVHRDHQQQLIQSWVGATYSAPQQVSPTHSPAGSNPAFSPVTPAFFSPNFLDSLQGDGRSSPRQLTSDQPYAQPVSSATNTRSLDWPNELQATPADQQFNTSVQTRDMLSPPASPPHSSNSSSNSSPPITPMYGRLSNLSIRSTPAPVPTQMPYNGHYYDNPIPANMSSGHTMMVAHPPTIPEAASEEDDGRLDVLQHQNHQNVIDRRSVKSNRQIIQAVQAATFRPHIQKYLRSPDPTSVGERTVVILTSKVAQKSYGTEKRFLCPPPTAILVGTTWWTPKKDATLDDSHVSDDMLSQPPDPFLIDNERVLAPPKLTVCISGEASSQAGHIEWYTVSGVTVGQTGHVKAIQSSSNGIGSTQQEGLHPNRFRSAESRNNNFDWYQNHHQEPLAAGKSVSKHLFINDADEKRKRVECLVKIQLANGLLLGTLASKGIKVISKPSKKRQSVKNMELCIHHGTTVSLFNRIRSQTVSTKYLGVSTSSPQGSPYAFPGHAQPKTQATDVNDGTCFVARTTCWDPFVVWVVDTTRSPVDGKESDTAEDYIGRNVYTPSVPYPPPPAIALKNKTNQLVPILYNQHIVLQCLTTGLVSPVMIIRKVDKASTVVGGARSVDDPHISGGGEYGDEVFGDPVSQLHKIALQIVQDPSNAVHAHQAAMRQQDYSGEYDINYNNSGAFPPTPHLQETMMPRTNQPVTYLACLNDMVGMHKTVEPRRPLATSLPQPTAAEAAAAGAYFQRDDIANSTVNYTIDSSVTSQQEGGKVVRKRRVSTDVLERHLVIGSNGVNGIPPSKLVTSMSLTNLKERNPGEILDPSLRRRVNSMNDDIEAYYGSRPNGGSAASHILMNRGRSGSTHSLESSKRKPSMSTSSSSSSASTGSRRMSAVSMNSSNPNHGLGSYWSEDVSDAAVWTIVGTDCAVYTFWTPPVDEIRPPSNSNALIFPTLVNYTLNHSLGAPYQNQKNANLDRRLQPTTEEYLNSNEQTMSLHGESFSRDLQVWFGDIKALDNDYRSRELIVCRLPTRQNLLEGAGLETIGIDNTTHAPIYSLPILLVRGDGTVYKTTKTYQFQ